MPRKPNFFIVGAPKCGTTAMYEYLRSHPDIFMPETVKEPHFFAPQMANPRMKPYTEAQNYFSLFAAADGYKRVGEASAFYLYTETAAQAIHTFNSDAYIIIMLRSPIEVIDAYYYQALRSGNETMPTLEAALAAENERKQGRQLIERTIASKQQYRAIARFAPQVNRYFEVFGREAVHVIIYDDLKAAVAQVYRDTLAFLQVDTTYQPTFEMVNANQLVRFRQVNRFIRRPPAWILPFRQKVRQTIPATVRHQIGKLEQTILWQSAKRPAMNSETKRQLQIEFLPDVEQLSVLLERDLTHWCRD